MRGAVTAARLDQHEVAVGCGGRDHGEHGKGHEQRDVPTQRFGRTLRRLWGAAGAATLARRLRVFALEHAFDIQRAPGQVGPYHLAQ